MLSPIFTNTAVDSLRTFKDFTGWDVPSRIWTNPTKPSRHCNERSSIKPEDYDARFQLGLVLSKVGSLEQSRDELKAASTLNPNAPEVHYQLSQVLSRLGNKEEAEQELQKFRMLEAKNGVTENRGLTSCPGE